MAYGNLAGVIHLVDVDTGRDRLLRGHTGFVSLVRFSPDDSSLATAGEDGDIRLWNVSTGDMIATLKSHKDIVRCLAFSPDGQTLISGDIQNTLCVWEVGEKRVKATYQADVDSVIAFTADGGTFVTGGPDVKVWETASGRILHTVPNPDPVTSVYRLGVTGDGTTIAAATADGNLYVWTGKPPELARTISGFRRPVHAVAFSPDGKVIATGDDAACVKLFETSSGREIAGLTDRHTKGVCYVRFTADGRTLVSAGRDGVVVRWAVPGVP
jgi:WD40 repeat protein